MNGALLMVANRLIKPGLIVITQPGDESTRTFRAFEPQAGARLLAALHAVLDQFTQEADSGVPTQPATTKEAHTS